MTFEDEQIQVSEIANFFIFRPFMYFNKKIHQRDFGVGVTTTYLGDVKRCGVAVVQSHSVEILRCDLSVLLHVGPQVGTVLRTLPVAQLHTVAPADQLSTQVHIRACRWSQSRLVDVTLNKPFNDSAPCNPERPLVQKRGISHLNLSK